MDYRIDFGVDTIESSFYVNNVVSDFIQPVAITWHPGDFGTGSISADVWGYDVSPHDNYRLHTSWSESSTLTTVASVPGSVDTSGPGIAANCATDPEVDCTQTRTFETEFEYAWIETDIVTGASTFFGINPLPAVFTLKDDDLGESHYFYNEIEIDGNYDDDDGDGVEDVKQASIDFVDNELTGFSLSQLWPTNYDLEKGDFFLEYDPNVIRIWDSPGKETLISPSYYGGGGGDYCSASNHGIDGPYNVISEGYEEFPNVWIEGIGGSTSIVMGFHSEYGYYHSNGTVYGGEVLVTVDAPAPDPGAILVEELYWGDDRDDPDSWHPTDVVIWDHNQHKWDVNVTGDSLIFAESKVPTEQPRRF